MTSILVDGVGAVLGYSDPLYTPEPPIRVLPAPEGFQESDFDFLVYENGALRVDASANLDHLKAARIAAIKQEAADLIASTDWQLQRAQERESAGWAGLAAVDAVLAARESIRRSSDAAEVAVLKLASRQAVRDFVWTVDVLVASPQRRTHAEFLDALETQGEDVIPSILMAKESSPALLKWWTYFDQAQVISTTDPRLEAGLQGLEIAGLLPKGGALAVLAVLQGR